MAAIAALIGRPPAALRTWLLATRARWRFDKELRLLPFLVERSEASVDIGANRGVYTWPLARLSRTVHAFEPNPDLARRLRQSFGRGVVVHSCGLSDREGQGTLWIPRHEGRQLIGRGSVEIDANPGFASEPCAVELSTLDSFGLEDCGFIKAHVEGHELAVLRGARRTLERCRPSILVAGQARFHPDLPFDIFACLSSLGYRGYFLDHGRLRPFDCFDPLLHQRPELVPMPGDKRGLTEDFIYNFIYIHESRPVVRKRLAHLMTDEEDLEGRTARRRAVA